MTVDESPLGTAVSSARRSRSRVTLWVGLGLIGSGLAILGWLGWEFWGTNWISHRTQARVIAALHEDWANGKPVTRVSVEATSRSARWPSSTSRGSEATTPYPCWRKPRTPSWPPASVTTPAPLHPVAWALRHRRTPGDPRRTAAGHAGPCGRGPDHRGDQASGPHLRPRHGRRRPRGVVHGLVGDRTAPHEPGRRRAAAQPVTTAAPDHPTTCWSCSTPTTEWWHWGTRSLRGSRTEKARSQRRPQPDPTQPGGVANCAGVEVLSRHVRQTSTAPISVAADQGPK